MKYERSPGLVVLLMALVMMLAACAAGAPAATPADSADGAAGPQSGGEVVVAIGSEPDMLYPQRGSSSWAVLVNATLYDTLLYLGPDGTLQPGLAESWEVSEDASTFTFHLRDDVTFHDGTPFNAEAVKFSFDRIMDPEAAAWAAYAYVQPDKIESVVVLDEYTLQVNYLEPFAPFLTAMTTGFLAPVSPTAVEEWGEDFGRHPVGTGPFKFVEWVSGSHVTVERNPDYAWAPPFFENEGPAYLDEITFRFITESQTRLASLETGEVDIAEAVPAREVPRFQGDPEFQIIERVQSGNGMILQVNHDQWPGSEKAVREAMNYALNQEAINRALYGDLFQPAHGPISSATPCYWEGVEEMYPHDLERAQQILADAGFEDTDGDGILELDGEPLALDFYWNAGITGWTELAEAVQAQLRPAGIDVVLHGLDRTAYFSAVHDGQQDMNFMWYPREDPDILRILFHSDGAVAGGFNRAYYRNEKVDEYLESGAEAGSMEQRCEWYEQAQQLIMEDAAIVPVNNQVTFWGARNEVKGLVLTRDDLLYQDVYLGQ